MAPSHIELHIFTNATRFAPDTATIESTYNSFHTTFGPVGTTCVWYDPNPNKNAAREYKQNLDKMFGCVMTTSSLVDGYSRALKESDADFLFMLEHDWNFIPGRISHSLEEICRVMARDELLHLRFNRFENRSHEGDVGLVEGNSERIPYCVTPQLSNNPHIIQRQKYIGEALAHLDVSKGVRSKGIEEKLFYVENLFGAIYGPWGHPPTVNHLDGAGRGSGTLAKIRNDLGAAKGELFKWMHKLRSSIR